MATLDLAQVNTNYTARLVLSLLTNGWAAVRVPPHGRLARNRQLLELQATNDNRRFRISVYAVGDRGESGRRDERRVEITTTYENMEPLGDFRDVVLGYDRDNGIYVGLDTRRLE